MRTGSIVDAYAYEHSITSLRFDAGRVVAAAGESCVKIYDRYDGRQWLCGDENACSVVEEVRCKEGYLIAGNRDGAVGVYAC